MPQQQFSKPAKRDRVIELQQRPSADAADPSSHEPIDGTWTTLVERMPAGKTNVAGWERFRANQDTARYDQIWEINWRNDMDPNLIDVPKVRRIKDGARFLDIVYAEEIGRRGGIALYTAASAGV